ncbi:hypothetical protein DFH06DRAFT_1314727 [Mycena polygramma]|nr:hypothetical protein DFH06DRAFT_1314727 [Mycena polygramma]
MSAAVEATAVCPAGYTYAFLEPKYFFSTKAEKMTKTLLTEAQTLRPLGILDLIDSTLITIHSKIVRKDWDSAFTTLEVLTLFNEFEDDWPMYDDGRRVELTNKLYGTSLVTVLRALKTDDRLDVSHFPSLETLLRQAAEWGANMKSIGCESDYDLVCKAIGARLFPTSPTDVAAKEKARLDAWLASRSQEERDEFDRMRRREAEDDDEEDSDDEDAGPWHAGGSDVDEDMKNSDLLLPPVWKEYNDYLHPAKRQARK